MSDKTIQNSKDLRGILNRFWDESLEIESTQNEGFIFTMPMSYPDGWQIMIELSPQTPGQYLLTDKGKTLTWLNGHGQNTATDSMNTHIQRLCKEHFMKLENGILSRWVKAPFDATDIHVFAEGLVAISRLNILNEHRASNENIAESTIMRILRDAGLEPKVKHRLSITKERKVSVDYYIEQRSPIAIQLIKSKTDFSGTMEKWGFRWHELKKMYTGLKPIMLYDRNTQAVDSYSRHIGETECEIFCGYDETDRIHETLNLAR